MTVNIIKFLSVFACNAINTYTVKPAVIPIIRPPFPFCLVFVLPVPIEFALSPRNSSLLPHQNTMTENVLWVALEGVQKRKRDYKANRYAEDQDYE